MRRRPRRQSPYQLFLHGNKGRVKRDTTILLGLAVGLSLVSWTSYHFGYGWGYGAPSKGPDATFQDVLHGKFPSGKTKWGDAGTIVTVHHVVIHKETKEDDGDWFWAASDPSYQNGDFVLEVITRDQGASHQPPLNTPLTISGVPYCDTVHGTEERANGERWHTGGSCWELHPVYSWVTESTLEIGFP